MKKLTKLFLLVLCSWFLFFWFNYAQDLEEEDFYTDEYDNLDPEYDLWGWDTYTMSYEPDLFTGDGCHYNCETNVLWQFSQLLLIWIWITLWIMLIILTVKVVTLYKKLHDNQNKALVYIPIINLYSISKITIGKTRFLCIIVLIWFFWYSVYRNISENWCCINFPSRQDYAWIIVWISAIIILWELLSWLSKFNKKNSDKKYSDKIE